MERRKKNQTGITLIALVISIIVMLILAGVSLNMTIGENGIVTKAQEAAEISKKTSIIEEIQSHLMKYNIDLLSGDKKTAAKTAIDNLISDNVVDNCMTSAGTFTTDTSELAVIPLISEDGSWTGEFEYVVGKDNYNFNIYQDKEGIFKAEISDIIAGDGASGGEVTGGKTLVTSKTFTSGDTEDTDANEKGKYTIVGDASVIFADELEGSYSIYVKSGANATVSIFYSMNLSNKNLKRSAIDIEPGATLNLWIAEGATVTVDSGYATKATQANGVEGDRGIGGFAGIHVPNYTNYSELERTVFRGRDDSNNEIWYTYPSGVAVLNLSGEGKLISRGGNASEGGDALAGDIGGSGGGGAGAGIGGNGGIGGLGGAYAIEYGGKGEDCGIINIHGSLNVEATGGAGASGYKQQHLNAADSSSGTGAGGYPAAGIGGGGAGGGAGTHIQGGGGYSCGINEQENTGVQSINGISPTNGPYQDTNGGSYFTDSVLSSTSNIAQIGGHKRWRRSGWRNLDWKK